MGKRLHGIARLGGWLTAFWRIYRDPRTPRWAKYGLTALAIVYALSPVDVVPEAIFGPLGLLDDAVLVPLLLWLITRFAPASVRRQARRAAGLEEEADSA
ncbi:MAG: YkvA family protein [Phycisphaeraceae bacterium]